MFTLYGTKRSDVLYSLKPVEVFAGRGDDWLGDIGKRPDRPTADIYHGGAGDDFIFTYSGKDKVFGDSGNDTLVANTSSSFSYDGGEGFDVLELKVNAPGGYLTMWAGDEIVAIKVGAQIVSLHDVEAVLINKDTLLEL
ncbi:hypothetical protein [Rhizobium alvei]|uniref:Uncharacterized protein n=1 Tax=Rhizobium alvei TaxID=1132659 RepID=A0ABT8YQ39_9HYPH|nr:hypothetical protein [Rhizobium alvei]MDO6965793.1 hypothetical protein [Rhizobium alvei]